MKVITFAPVISFNLWKYEENQNSSRNFAIFNYVHYYPKSDDLIMHHHHTYMIDDILILTDFF